MINRTLILTVISFVLGMWFTHVVWKQKYDNLKSEHAKQQAEAIASQQKSNEDAGIIYQKEIKAEKTIESKRLKDVDKFSKKTGNCDSNARLGDEFERLYNSSN